MGQSFRVCPGSSPQLESGLLSFCSPWLGGGKKAQALRPPTQRLCAPRALRVSASRSSSGTWGCAPYLRAHVSGEHPLLRFDFLPFLSRVYNFTNE